MFHTPAHKNVSAPAGQIINAIAAPARSADFAVSDHGTIVILTALSEEAARWVRIHIPADAQRWGGGIAIQDRFAPAILNGIEDDGLVVA